MITTFVLIWIVSFSVLLTIMYLNKGKKGTSAYRMVTTALAIFITTCIGYYFFTDYYNGKNFFMTCMIGTICSVLGMLMKLILEKRVFNIS